MKYIYTDTAKQELEKYLAAQQVQLEKRIAEKKFVPGDPCVEITASDIKEFLRYSRLFSDVKLEDRRLRRDRLRIMTKFYMLIGGTMVVFGVFYSQLMVTVANDPFRAAMIFGGIATIMMGFVSGWLIGGRYHIAQTYFEDSRDEDNTSA